MSTLVVARNSNINELGWRVHIAESHDWDVGIRSLSNRLMFSSWVTDEKQPRLTESSLDLIGECSRGIPSSDGAAANISCKLQNSPLSLWSVGNNKHILGVFNSCDSSGSEQKLLPGLPQVDDVDTILPLLEDVLLHRGLAVVRSDVRGSGQHLGDVIFGNS